jgi:multidrug transporter EmrE-like cation transporter
MWFRLMMLAVIFNGIGDFGLRVLQEAGHAASYTPHYLIVWYFGGAIAMTVIALRSRRQVKKADLAISAALALCSVCGQMSLGQALAEGITGSVAYPVTKTGGVFLVALAGTLIFRERVGPVGLAGIVCGIVAVLLLSFE